MTLVLPDPSLPIDDAEWLKILTEAFPAWSFWHSPAGYWRGTHHQELTEEQAVPDSPFRRTVEAETARELATELARQEILRGTSA
ncbi:hypothetical protein ACFY3V_33100 [Streptosporangium sp. NPDC000095]|uniref:hypothetical protein n=1 Tax=Streptosporangium sp. NPDC000095 TaxID=3366184 RepID=UPI003699ACDA